MGWVKRARDGVGFLVTSTTRTFEGAHSNFRSVDHSSRHLFGSFGRASKQWARNTRCASARACDMDHHFRVGATCSGVFPRWPPLRVSRNRVCTRRNRSVPCAPAAPASLCMRAAGRQPREGWGAHAPTWPSAAFVAGGRQQSPGQKSRQAVAGLRCGQLLTMASSQGKKVRARLTRSCTVASQASGKLAPQGLLGTASRRGKYSSSVASRRQEDGARHRGE